MFNPPFDTFKNRLKDIYIAKRNEETTFDDYNNQIVTYQEPYFYGRRNYQPLDWKTLKAYKEEFGIVKQNMAQLLLDYPEKNAFEVYDLVYLYGAKPENEEFNGQKANYVVRAVREQNTKVMIILEQRVVEE